MSGRARSARRHQNNQELHPYVHGTLDRESLESLAPDMQVDALGTFCPEPVIRTQNRMAHAKPGEIAMLLADDVGVEIDIPAWCLSTGNEYLGLLKAEVGYKVFVRRLCNKRPQP
ncbi:MAG: sulfurtransferase TusA family protein [Acidobacteriota bacterium]|nr:hypothetical protein [Acidobacteriota bacterium]MEC8944428.1 sulfurtransferase TusA family protein [Acidobacteriota bacterium]